MNSELLVPPAPVIGTPSQADVTRRNNAFAFVNEAAEKRRNNPVAFVTDILEAGILTGALPMALIAFGIWWFILKKK